MLPAAAFVGVLALFQALPTAAPDVSPQPAETPTPVQIYFRAFERLATYPVPPYVVWSDYWKITARLPPPPDDFTPIATQTAYESLRYAARTSDEMENVTDLLAAPGPLPNALIAPVFQGPFAWTIRPPTAKAASSQSNGPDLSALKVIASVTAYEKPGYAIDLAGIEKMDGRDVYHLHLRPLTDPKKHNLRELWIDVATYDVRKAHYTGTYSPFPDAPSSPSDIVSYFKPIAQYWVVYRMVWTYRDRASFVYDVLTIDIAFPNSLPDWMFDEIQYPAQVRAKTPDVLFDVLHGVPTPSPEPS